VSDSARIVPISVSPGLVPSARVTTLGLEGDVQRDREHHHARVLREGSLTSGDPVRLLTEDEASSLLGAR
jgi:MOSC domain-containing protein YiiM